MPDCGMLIWVLGTLTGVLIMIAAIGLSIKRNLDRLVGKLPME